MSLRRLFAAAAACAALGALPAAAFDLTDTAGKPQRLADFKGRWVVLNFWATWCVPCIQEIPEISAFRKAHGDVVVWGGPARLRFHGVMPLAEGEDRFMGACRINLTFRCAA